MSDTPSERDGKLEIASALRDSADDISRSIIDLQAEFNDLASLTSDIADAYELAAQIEPLPPSPIVIPSLGDMMVDYMQADGDQEIVVPNGRYKAGTISIDRPATDGKFNGWLVLRAETPGEVFIDQAAAALILKGNQRVMLIDFASDNGLMQIDASNVTFWGGDFTFPHTTWAEQDGWPHDRHTGWSMVNNVPRTAVIGGASSNVNFYGVDLHDTGSMITYEGSSGRDSKVLGCHFWGIGHGGAWKGKLYQGTAENQPEWWDEWVAANPTHPFAVGGWPGSFDPYDRLHGAAIGNAAGGANNLEIGWCHIHDNARFRDRNDPRYTSETTKGLSLSTNDHSTNDMWIHDMWIHGVDHGMQIRTGTHRAGKAPQTFTNGRVSAMNVWGCGNKTMSKPDGDTRTDWINDADGKPIRYRTSLGQWNATGDRRLQATTLDWRGEPEVGEQSPSEIWRAQNPDPYRFMGWPNG